MKNLILVRGLPGSGKSTLAKNKFSDYIHLEADMWMNAGLNSDCQLIDKSKVGEYDFSPSRLKAAHKCCQTTCCELLKAGKKVIVTNTFIKLWELKPYIDFGFDYKVIECKEQYGSEHDVPDYVMNRMKANFEKFEKSYFIL